MNGMDNEQLVRFLLDNAGNCIVSAHGETFDDTPNKWVRTRNFINNAITLLETAERFTKEQAD